MCPNQKKIFTYDQLFLTERDDLRKLAKQVKVSGYRRIPNNKLITALLQNQASTSTLKQTKTKTTIDEKDMKV